jgi:hypothetical protein
MRFCWTAPAGDVLDFDPLGNTFSIVGKTIVTDGGSPTAYMGVNFVDIESLPLMPVGTAAVLRLDLNRIASSPTQAGYTPLLPTAGYAAVGSGGAGYGWEQPLVSTGQTSSGGFDRTTVLGSGFADLLRDGHFSNTAQIFRADVGDDGWYLVSVKLGDAGYPRDQMQVRNADTGCVAIDYTTPSSRLFDFNSNTSPTQSPSSPPTVGGYIGVLPTDTYTPQRGYGWDVALASTGSTQAGGYDRGDFAGTQVQEELRRDGHFANRSAGPRTFSVDLPSATNTYLVNVTLGGDVYWMINGLDIAESAAGLPPAAPLTLSEFGGSPSALGGSQSTSLTAESLAPIVSTAIAQWQTQNLTALQAWRLNNVEFRIAELASASPHYLDLAGSRLVLIDDNAAGYGWSLDVTRGPAAGQVDLLSAVMHELGHVLGYDHSDDVHNVMFSTLAPTLRPNVLEPFSSVASRASDFLTPSLFASSNSTRLSSSQPFTARDQLFTRLGESDSLLTDSPTPRVDESHEPFATTDRTTDRRVSRAKRHHDDLFAAWDPSQTRTSNDVLELLGQAHQAERAD